MKDKIGTRKKNKQCALHKKITKWYTTQKQTKKDKSVQWDNIDRMKASELQYILHIINKVRSR